jgi:hypothetical protein
MKKLLAILLFTSITSLSYSQTNTIKLENEIDEIELPIFVLRYKGVILDVCPLEKDYNGGYDGFQSGHTQFKFKNNKVTKDELIELVSRYKFTLRGDYVVYGKVSFRLLDDDDNLPTYLTIKKEIIKIK